MGAMLGKFAVVLDTVARFGVVVVGALLVREFWGAIGLPRSRSPGVDVESRSSDRVDPIGTPGT